MAELAPYAGANLLSFNSTNAAIARGARVVLDSSQTVSAAGATVRGEGVAMYAGAALAPLAVGVFQSGGVLPCIGDAAIAINTAVYSAASGKVSATSTNAVLIGKAFTACTADGTLFSVLIENPV